MPILVKANLKKTACFYGVKFEKTPNFSQVEFNGKLNLVNTKLNFDFKDCKEAFDRELTIQKEREIQIFNEKIIHKEPKEIANDFRDSFRIFKSALIKDNNLLDASNHHKIELYYKEIELKESKLKFFSKEWLEWLTLWFYRLTSNHHTDLLKILCWTLILVGGLGILMFLSQNFKSGLSNTDKFWLFGAAFWFLVCFIICCCKKLSAVVFFGLFALCPILHIICYKPKLIFGIGSILSENQSGTLENIIKSIYIVFAFLFVYSLQKTARKNSIIPS